MGDSIFKMYKKKEKIEDYKYLTILSLLFLLPLFIEFLTLLHHEVNYCLNSIIRLIFLSVSILSVRRQIKILDIKILIVLYSFFFINYLCFPSTNTYYIYMLNVFVFYLPLAVIVVRKICNWDNFFLIVKPYSLLGVLLAICIVSVSDIDMNLADIDDGDFSYMKFSYCILPFIAILYVLLRKQKTFFLLCNFLIGFMCILLYGARATFFLLLLFIAFYEVYAANHRFLLFVVLGAIIALVTVFFDELILWLSEIPEFSESRFVVKALAGQLTDGGDRDVLVEQSIRRIIDAGFEVSGFFGDRKYIKGVYPHNIILEIGMQFGLILGVFMILFIIFIILKSLFFSKYPLISVYLCCVLFGRYMFSGSYVLEGSFWIWIFAMISVCNCSKGKIKSISNNN